ncbi:protein THEM6-like [Adelges cooleyi]|uniref:protein THEM6-like n=1 Tax=Adelges cooleyi TaxID=133065 RepID=UPI00218055DB|nr:protein THEM6-like [Adelges cooleyi]XP_050434470.1 protein THEM6-like [Adelges cooleyi]
MTPSLTDSVTTVALLAGGCAVLFLALLAMCLVDVPYFFRSLFSYVAGTWLKKKLRPTDTAVYSSVCSTTDLDVYLTHMNNARYLREVDFARIEFLMRTGLWRELRRRGGLMFTIANSIRYRKFVRTCSSFEIRTRIVYWDDMSIFFEHRFVTKGDGFVRAVLHNRQRVTVCSADELIRSVAGSKAQDAALRKPDCPLDIHHWIQSNLMSSASLKAECDMA